MIGPFPSAASFRSGLSLAWVLLLATLGCGDPLSPWLERMRATHHTQLVRKLGPELRALGRGMGLGPDDSATTEAILRPLFLHHLLTTSAPVDGTRGGVLESMYFWHWVNPNPRHEIRRLPDSSLLTSRKPHPRHAMYRSWADMDRTPDLFLADLVSERPGYFHPRFGTFSTFGWCSEREMAYTLLLTRLGHVAKIKFQGNHVWTEVLVRGKASDGSTKTGILVVDNTFGRVQAAPLGRPVAAWLSDIGPGKDVVGMNAKAKGAAQRALLDGLEVGPAAAERIENQVSAWLSR